MQQRQIENLWLAKIRCLWKDYRIEKNGSIDAKFGFWLKEKGLTNYVSIMIFPFLLKLPKKALESWKIMPDFMYINF